VIVYSNGITESCKPWLRFYNYLSDFAIFQENDSSGSLGVRVDQYLEHLGSSQRMIQLKEYASEMSVLSNVVFNLALSRDFLL
jgi:hypothetical protein